MNALVLILIIILLTGGIGTLPHFGYTAGYSLSGGIGLVLVIILILALLGRI